MKKGASLAAPKRKFVLVPADAVPNGVGGCQYCASGRRPTVKLKQQPGAGGATSSPAARRPLSQAGHENRVTRVSGLNYANAEAFIASIPDGCWTSFKDVATAAGNPDAAMPIGNWLRDSGGFVDKDWRVLRSDGYIPDGFVGHAPGLPHDAQSGRDLLRAEGVRFSHAGEASETQRFRYEHWTGRAATSWSPDCDPPPAPTGIQIGMTVRIRDLDSGEQRTWTLVAKPNASPSDGRLSIESPIRRGPTR
jgi:alkylated DNA nucleotide flippase Atl1